MEKEYAPQQTAPIAPGYPGVQPPKGWVPPLGGVLNLIGVYDTDKGVWVGLPLQALTQALVLAEALHTMDRIDERDYVEVTVTVYPNAGFRRGEPNNGHGAGRFSCRHGQNEGARGSRR